MFWRFRVALVPLVAASLWLGACDLIPGPATRPGPIRSGPTQPAPAEAATRPLPPPPPKAKPPKTPAPVQTQTDPNELVGLDEDGVRRLLGSPAEAHNEGAARILSYRAANCGLDVILFLDVKAGDLRVLSYQFDEARRQTPGACYDGLRVVK